MATTGSVTTGLASGLVDSLNTPSTATTEKQKKNNEIGQNEFLTLLITQLQNQDPLNPMDNSQFAVDMSQFAQVEQLLQINKKLGDGASDVGNLAAYLGHEVTLNTDQVTVEAGDGGLLKLHLTNDAESVTVELLNEDGTVVSTLDAGTLSKGKHTLALQDVDATDGQYAFRVKAKDASGVEITSKASVAGVVSGFVPGADQKLLIGERGREISLADILEVGLASS